MQYIVHCVNPELLDGREVPDRASERGIHVPEGMQTTVAGSIHTDILSIGTWYFQGEPEALDFARFVAKKKPGHDVYVAEVKYSVQAVVPEAIVKNVSKKGILPS